MQLWDIFDGLTGLDDEGQETRTIIRERLAKYDDIEMHSAVTTSTRTPDSGSSILLPETNEESIARVCSLSGLTLKVDSAISDECIAADDGSQGRSVLPDSDREDEKTKTIEF